MLQQARDAGYRITLHFLWLPSVKVSLARVRQRVKMGGHDVPEAEILRRHDWIMRNLVELYLPLVDRWRIWTSKDLRFERLGNFGIPHYL